MSNYFLSPTRSFGAENTPERPWKCYWRLIHTAPASSVSKDHSPNTKNLQMRLVVRKDRYMLLNKLAVFGNDFVVLHGLHSGRNE
ncbi:hypothetical protein Gasu2_13650 [Galdieria sulphuraria]|nr:hypothetical protein Gasu2_13650 [Galdieria sulphuraria]